MLEAKRASIRVASHFGQRPFTRKNLTRAEKGHFTRAITPEANLELPLEADL